jgi:small-conductance mechanosensitive channel
MPLGLLPAAVRAAGLVATALALLLLPLSALADAAPPAPSAHSAMHSVLPYLKVPAIVAGVVVAAFLVNRFAPKKRRHVRRTVIVLLMYLGTFGAASLLGSMEGGGWTSSLQVVSELCGGLTIISTLGLLIFDLGLPAVGINLATIVVDLTLGAAYLVAVMAALRTSGVHLSGIVATSAVVTGIIALSLQATLGNIVGGLALQLDDSIHVGDWIQLENGKQGRVREIRWRHTVIETRDWDTIIVPNASLLAANILILGKREGEPLQRRMSVAFCVDFRTNPNTVIATVEQALREAAIEGVAATPLPQCVCLDFARDGRDSMAYYSARYWITDIARDDPANSRVRARIYTALKRADIPLALPAAQLFVEQDDVERRQRKQLTDLERRKRALGEVEFLKPLTDDELTWVASKLHYAPFASGETITRQGSTAHELYIVKKGRAEVRISNQDKHRVVAVIEAPGFFGEMALMTGEPRSANVVALTEMECYRLDREAFDRILQDRPEVAAEISALLARRRVELQAVREHFDADTTHRRIEDERVRLLSAVQNFFGLSERN